MPFNFNRLAFPVPHLDPRQGDAAAVIRLGGSLRARARPDGLVDVEIETNRMLFGLEKSDSSPGPAFATTRKTLTLKSDETTAIEFPPPASGYASLALDKGGSGVGGVVTIRPGAQAMSAGTSDAEVKDGRFVLFTNRFFKGHRTQLLVRLRRLP